ncbi:MAG: hypothetical protein HRT86_09790 [Ilumatobacteraceae bacterium]|nr:hypothetical protein [Ilumatobacteraceae bacterium]
MNDDQIPIFAALGSGYSVDTDGRRLPTVAIDASDSPEIADLARVHAVEGVGDVRTEAARLDDTIVLAIRMSVPVEATFAIAFDVERYQALFDEVIEQGSLVIAHTDPERAATEHPQWLAIDIDGPALASQLARGA